MDKGYVKPLTARLSVTDAIRAVLLNLHEINISVAANICVGVPWIRPVLGSNFNPWGRESM